MKFTKYVHRGASKLFIERYRGSPFRSSLSLASSNSISIAGSAARPAVVKNTAA